MKRDMVLRLFAALFLGLFFTAGCGMTVSSRIVLPEQIAVDVKDFSEKIDILKTGMTLAQVSETLSLKKDKTVDLYKTVNVVHITDGHQKTCIIYSCFAQDKDQLEYARNSTVFQINFVLLPTTMDIVPWKLGADFNDIGSDAKVFLIFNKDFVLDEVRKPDRLYVNERNEVTVFSAIKEVGSGSASQAGRKLINLP